MTAHSSSAEDKAFRDAFEACIVAPAQFNHGAHLRLAYVYLVDDDTGMAHRKMRSALRGFLQAHSIPLEKFHETLTRAWVLAVRHFMNRAPSRSFAEFIEHSQPLLDSQIMLTHYSAGLLFSADARASFVAPDLEAIPH